MYYCRSRCSAGSASLQYSLRDRSCSGLVSSDPGPAVCEIAAHCPEMPRRVTRRAVPDESDSEDSSASSSSSSSASSPSPTDDLTVGTQVRVWWTAERYIARYLYLNLNSY